MNTENLKYKKVDYIVGIKEKRKSRREELVIRPIKKQLDAVFDISKPDEEWKPVTGFEDYYYCSNYGRILGLDGFMYKRGFACNKKGRLLSAHFDTEGYLSKTFKVRENKKQLKISRLVAQLFVDGWDESLDVNHIDFDKGNNYYKNLNYKTKPDNTKYSAYAGRFSGNANHFKSRGWREKNITIQYDLNGNYIKEYDSLADAAKGVNGNKGMISRAIVGRSNTAYGYKWAYKK